MRDFTKPSGQLIRYYRLLAQLKYREAAEALNTSIGHILKWEREEVSPNAESLAKIADAYGCEVSDLFLANVQEVKNVSTSLILDYYVDPDYDKQRKAEIAIRALSIPESLNVNVNVEAKSLDDFMNEQPIEEEDDDGQAADIEPETD